MNKQILGYVFQPIVDINRRVVSYEALARRGFVGQSIYNCSAKGIEKHSFEEQAEKFIESLVSMPLDFWSGQIRTVSFNMEPKNCTEENVNHLNSLCRQNNIKPNLIELELIETSATTLPTVAIGSIKQAGFGVALDDFGVGHSDVSAILNYPFDRIKFDRTFLSSDFGIDILAAIHPVIKRAGFKTTVEGIETEYLFNKLGILKPDGFQGWLFGRGMTVFDITKSWQSEAC